MTAHDQMRAMLDQLMGTGRNGKKNLTKNVISTLWLINDGFFFSLGKL